MNSREEIAKEIYLVLCEDAKKMFGKEVDIDILTLSGGGALLPVVDYIINREIELRTTLWGDSEKRIEFLLAKERKKVAEEILKYDCFGEDCVAPDTPDHVCKKGIEYLLCTKCKCKEIIEQANKELVNES